MTIDALVKLLDAIGKLIGVVIWPMLLLFIVVRFGPGLKEFFSSLGEFSFKGAGFEATAKRRAEAAAALVAASVARPRDDKDPGSAAEEAKEAAAVVAESVTTHAIRRATGARVLWVDDRPNNNIYERQSMAALGISFELASSTDEALDKLARKDFDVIISDMGRPPDPRAGYTLLDKLRSAGNGTPFVIYAGSNAPEHKAEARRHGALGCTNRASELFSYVLSAINRGSDELRRA